MAAHMILIKGVDCLRSHFVITQQAEVAGIERSQNTGRVFSIQYLLFKYHSSLCKSSLPQEKLGINQCCTSTSPKATKTLGTYQTTPPTTNSGLPATLGRRSNRTATGPLGQQGSMDECQCMNNINLLLRLTQLLIMSCWSAKLKLFTIGQVIISSVFYNICSKAIIGILVQ